MMKMHKIITRTTIFFYNMLYENYITGPKSGAIRSYISAMQFC